MSYRRMVPILTLLLIFGVSMRVSVDTDSWWHLAAGRWMEANGEILRNDVFSHSVAGASWTNPSWFAQILIYRTYTALGLAGLNLLTAVLACVGLILLWPVLRGPPLLKSFILIWAAVVAAIFWAARPHMFSFALTGGFIHLLEKWRESRSRLIWLLPPLMVIWANLHGGFVIGFIVISLYIIGETLEGIRRGGWGDAFRLDSGSVLGKISPLLGAGAASLVAASLNPFGINLLLYPFQTVSIGSLRLYIQEWQSPNFHLPQAQPFAWMLLSSIVFFGFSAASKSATELLMVVVLGYMSLVSARNISTFALAAAPILSKHGANLLSRIQLGLDNRELPVRVASVINGVLVLLVAVGIGAWSAPRLSAEHITKELEARMPAGAVRALAASGLEGPLFNSYDWGGYVIWQMWPEYSVYVDGRTDLYGDSILEEYLSLWRAEDGWEATMDKYGFRLALLEPSAPISHALRSAGWQVVSEDRLAVLLASPQATAE